jgi:hypothetical protein
VTSASRKSKGRKLQQLAAKGFADVGAPYGLVEDDFLSRSMGANGEDVIFSPAARRVFGDIRAECKAVESLNVTGVFYEHAAKYATGHNIPILIHKRARKDPLCTISLTYYLALLERSTKPCG